jgi:hypothetical protein
MTYENILVETRGPVGIITLNRPKALNALNAALIDELNQALPASKPTTTSAPSSSPAATRRSPPVPTSRKCSRGAIWTPIWGISSPAGTAWPRAASR